MRYFFLAFLAVCLPVAALAAAGGVGGGFGAEDWISKWPVLALVFAVVIGITSFFTVKIRARAKTKEVQS